MVKADTTWTPTRLRTLLTQDATYGIVKAGTFVRSGVPMIRGGDLKGGRIGREMPFVSVSKSDEYKRTVLKRGDVLIALVGYPGESAVVPEELEGANISRAVGLLRPKGNILPEFLCCYLNSAIGRSEFLKPSAGSAQIVVNLRDLNNLSVPVPAYIEEQKAIAEALANADALIESLEALISKKRAIKQGVMQEILTGRKRLPGFNGDWEIKTLGELGEALIGLTYSPNEVALDGTLVLRSSNVANGAIKFDDNVYVTATVPDRIMVLSGDILVCVRNGSRDLIGKCAKIDERCHGMTFGAFMAVYRTAHHDFLYHQFQSEILKRQIHEHLGATINQITNKSLKSFQVPFPLDQRERTAISNILSDMDAEISALEQKLVKARQIKHGMTQELLTGRVRLI